MTDLNTTMSIIILNVKRICAPVKRQKSYGRIKSKNQVYAVYNRHTFNSNTREMKKDAKCTHEKSEVLLIT